ncbi:MAG: hypothetical protein IAG10_28915 [Planctomycetaceae bacterium]|nr:hypothetical protein [Planctomycetaceae bacterium]
MCRIVGALSSLTVMVTLWAAFADDPRIVEADRLVQAPPAQFTPEQQEFASEVLDELGWTVLQAIQPFVSFENPVIDEAAAVEFLDELNLGTFRTMLKPELLFLRKVCDLSEPEYQTISQSCDAALREVVQQFVAEQEQDENDGKKPSIEPRPLPQRIRDAVSQIAECQLTPEQWARYSTEFQLRSAHHKRVAILNLVARLDHELRLSPTQREQFVKLLEANWKESWGQSLVAFTDESTFMPPLAQDDVRPILSPAQFEVLSELPYDDEPDIWGDGSIDWVLDMDEAVMADEEAPADTNIP